MAVQPGPTFKRYAANGAATVYTIPFLLLDPANLQITLNGVAVTSGFTLSGIGNPSSSCSFSVPPAGDLLFQQVMVFQRLTDYQMNGDFLSGTVNGDYDRLWLAIKQLSRDFGRALAVPTQELEGISLLPARAARLSRMLGFDSLGNPVSSDLTVEQIEQGSIEAKESAAQAAASELSAANSAQVAQTAAANAAADFEVLFNADQTFRAEEYSADKLARDAMFTLDQVDRYSAFASMQLEFGNDQEQRLEDFALLMQNTGYEVPVAYAPGIAITRPTQTVTYNGNQYRVKVSALPLLTTAWMTDSPSMVLVGDAALRQEMMGPDGAQIIGFKGRSVYEKLSDTLNIKDAPFLAKMDGVTDDSAAAEAFESHLRVNGGLGLLGDGVLYCKTYRFKSNMSTGAFKSYAIVGNGLSTTVKYGNVSPVLNGGGTAVVTREPDLFTISGIAGLQLAPRCRFANFIIDYSEQVFRGGASAATPALTDIKPLSSGVRAFSISYADGVEIENVLMKEIYGNGVILSKCPHAHLAHLRAFNVSGGNPGAADSTGGFIGIMRGSQVGTFVSHCIAINTRVYQTDTIAGYNNVTAKGTMCGYIGVWTEYGVEVDGTFAPGTDLWGAVTPRNNASMGCLVQNCMVYGYTLGFKSETNSPCVFSACVAINCWIPYICSGSQGRFVSCYADGGMSDLKQCPQSGYEYVRALFVHYNVNNQTWAYSGATFDGCMGFTRSMRINTTNCDNSRFLNQQIVIDHADAGKELNILATRAAVPLRGAKVSGTYIVRGLIANKSATIVDMDGMDLDIAVINMADKLLTVRLDAYYNAGDGCGHTDARVNSVGLVQLYARNSPGLKLSHKAYMVDATLQYPDMVLIVRGCDGAVVDYNHTLHSSAVVPGLSAPVEVSCLNPEVRGVLNIKDNGVNTIANMLLTNSVQPVMRLSKRGDTTAIPLIMLGTSAKGMHIEGIHTGGDASAVFNNHYGIVGPITFADGALNARRLTHTNLTYEPNHPDRLAKDTIEYMPGVTFNYLRPVLGAPAGCKAHIGGRRATAWAASAAIALNTVRASETDVYKATVAGTTGTVAPTHTAGDAVDGTVTWTWLAPRARFVELAKCDTTLI